MSGFVEPLFQPLAFLIVFGGTAGAAVASATREDLKRALAALKPCLRRRPAADARAAEGAVRQIQRISEYRGIVCADRVRTPVEFVHRAACRLAEAEGGDAFRRWAAEELDDRTSRHEAAIAVWRTVADAAPPMGMIGTVLGLIFMFARMDDVAAMGPAMATAMLTTLYGLVLSGIAAPIATRLERLSRAERQWQERVVARLEALARAEDSQVWQWRRQRPAA